MAAILLAACGSSDSGGGAATTTKAPGSKAGSTSPTGADELDGNQYVATGITGYEPVADSQLTLTFEDGQMSANAGCNTLGGAYSFEDGTLKWTDAPRATMMACSDELMAQDTWLTDHFTEGFEAEIDGKTLTLTSGDVVITLEIVADSPIADTAWTLTGTIANEAVSGVSMDTKPPTLLIAEDGAAQVFTGCNTGSTTVEVTETTLTFAPMAMTRMACEDAGTMLENQVTKVLDGEVLYTIEGNTLTITNGDLGLVYEGQA